MASQAEFDQVSARICGILTPVGFECHPFKMGWYNAQVSAHFILDYPPDTVAFIVISTPAMFEKAFIPFAQTQIKEGNQDPIDQCVAHSFNKVKESMGDQEVHALHDFELHHSRRPKVLVQTAGHVAGAARYYQRSDVINDPWDDKKRIFGVSVHPKYGGWFALRGVLILPGLEFPDLPQRAPPDVVIGDVQRIELLNRFNGNWQDCTFRDIIPVTCRYSELQKLYFATPPRERRALIDLHIEQKQTEPEQDQ